jgi:hypothetical protein
MNADFESRLQRQPLRELPRDWRADILAAAATPAGRRSRGATGEGETHGEGASTWPSLRAWATLGAAWVVIFLLHFTSPDEPRLARNSAPMTLQSFALLHEQTLRMADLLGQTDAGEPPVALPAPPQPRSERAPRQLIG